MKKEIEIMWRGNLPLSAVEWEFDTTAEVVFSRETEEKIKDFWGKAVKQYPSMYDGTLLCVQGIECQPEKITLKIGHIPFSVVHYHYENKKPLTVTNGSLGFQAKIYNPARTHLLIGQRVSTSDYKPGYTTIPGGIFEKKDLQGTIAEACIREIIEETAIEVKTETFRLLTIYREDHKVAIGLLIEVEAKKEIAVTKNESLTIPGNEEWEKQELAWYPTSKLMELKGKPLLEGLAITLNEKQ
ncbi:MAG: NUDIX hydrolase [Asgard group archaeon]|nr:NUDIX hydrolase [Asgard group archaeon]